jgi:hypothetical protein
MALTMHGRRVAGAIGTPRSDWLRSSMGPKQFDADQKTLFFLMTSRIPVLGFRLFVDFSAAARMRGTMLVRDRVVLTTSLILVLRCPFLHSGIFTFWIIVLHRAALL